MPDKVVPGAPPPQAYKSGADKAKLLANAMAGNQEYEVTDYDSDASGEYELACPTFEDLDE